jgi:aminodeoxyfutalosine deaminase
VPSTHLAETLEEAEFVRDARGPFADMLKRIGKWDDAIQATGLSPIEFFQDDLGMSPWLLAHCNYVSDKDLKILAKAGRGRVSVAYCSVASEYFGHTSHRYRDMLDAGINVCLGTDSILCQPKSERQPLGILPQMRRLFRRDRTDPGTLLAMATVRGARAIQFHEDSTTLSVRNDLGLLSRVARVIGKPEGPRQNVIAIRFDPTDRADALTQVLLNDYPVEPLTT